MQGALHRFRRGTRNLRHVNSSGRLAKIPSGGTAAGVAVPYGARGAIAVTRRAVERSSGRAGLHGIDPARPACETPWAVRLPHGRRGSLRVPTRGWRGGRPRRRSRACVGRGTRRPWASFSLRHPPYRVASPAASPERAGGPLAVVHAACDAAGQDAGGWCPRAVPVARAEGRSPGGCPLSRRRDSEHVAADFRTRTGTTPDASGGGDLRRSWSVGPSDVPTGDHAGAPGGSMASTSGGSAASAPGGGAARAAVSRAGWWLPGR